MKRKINSVLLASCLLLCLALAGCNRSHEANTMAQMEDSTTKETTEAVKETTEAITEAVTEITEAIKETTEAVTEATEEVTETTRQEEETTEETKSMVPKPVSMEVSLVESFIPGVMVGSYTAGYSDYCYNYNYNYLEIYQDKVIFYSGSDCQTFTSEQMSIDETEMEAIFTDGISTLKISISGDEYYSYWRHDNGTPDDMEDNIIGDMERDMVVNYLPGLLYPDYDSMGEWGAVPVDDSVKELLFKDVKAEDYVINYYYHENHAVYGKEMAWYELTIYDEEGYEYQPVRVLVFDSEETAKEEGDNSSYMTQYGHMLYYDERVEEPEPVGFGGKEYIVAGIHSYIVDEWSGYSERIYYSIPVSTEEATRRNSIFEFLYDKEGYYSLDDCSENYVSFDDIAGNYGYINICTPDKNAYIYSFNNVEQEGNTIIVTSANEWDGASYMVELTFLEGDYLTFNYYEYDYVENLSIEAARRMTPKDSITDTYPKYNFDEMGYGGKGG